MINQRLFNHYGIDTKKNLGIKLKCPRPSDTLLIDKMGSCYLCECTSWLPQSVGNLQLKSLTEIFRSEMADKIRNSINDGSYRFCNNKQCLYLHDLKRVQWKSTTPQVQIKEIRLAIDDSCNLRCPSCRTEKIFLQKGKQFQMRKDFINQIVAYINARHKYDGDLNIHIGSDGDPFASLIYRYFMKQVPDKKFLSYTFQTNGLLVKQMYPRVKHIFRNLKALNLSIDGATKETYEKLRLGGKWEKILENLNFIKSIKQEHGFEFNMHMVVQKDNWQEMTKMLDLAHQYNVNTLYFNPIQDWNTFTNFDGVRIPQDQPEFQKILEEVKKDPITNAW